MSGGREGYDSAEEDELESIKSDLVSSDDLVGEKLTCVPYLSGPPSPAELNSSRQYPTALTTDKLKPLTVKDRVASFESLSSLSFKNSVTMSLDDELKPLKGTRAAYKGRITLHLKGLKKLHEDGSLTDIMFKKEATAVNNYLDKIEDVELQMSCIWDNHSTSVEDSKRSEDMTKSVEHHQGVNAQLSVFEASLVKPDGATGVGAGNTNQDLVRAIRAVQGGPGHSMIKCQLFDGGSADRCNFKFWLSQFDTMLASSKPMADKYKLSVLRNHLTSGGLAFRTISDLDISDANYSVALDALKAEFLDINLIVHDLFKQIQEKYPKNDPEFESLRMYVVEIKSILNDLKNSYQTDLLTPGTGGYKLVSSIVFEKLPPSVQRALIEKVSNNYPTLENIFEHTKCIITTILKTKSKRVEPKFEANNKNFKPYKSNSEPKPALENFATSIGRGNQSYHCKFCDNDGHSSYYCAVYKTREQRVERCKALKLCFRCTSNKHHSSSCPGQTGGLYKPCRICNSKGHIGAMCSKDVSTGGASGKGVPSKDVKQDSGITDVCFSTGVGQSPYLMPIVSLKLRGHNGQTCKFNFLLDTASQRSYLSQHALSKLGCNSKLISDVEFEVKTFLGSKRKNLKEVNLDVFVEPQRHYGLLMLVDDQFDISFNVPGLSLALENLKTLGHELAADFNNKDLVSVHGLIGVDVVQHLKQVQMIKCMNGSVIGTSSGIAPIGDIRKFLYPNQISSLKPFEVAYNNFNSILSMYPCQSALVNFVLEPKLSYDDPFESFFDESSVERRVDKMLSCDSLGIVEGKDSLSDYDQERVDKFRNSIELINGEYHVDLSWHDNVDQVPSNEGIALNVLDRVNKDLEKKGLLNEYNDGLKKWETDGITERIEVHPKDYKNYNWTPHRPVFKTDEQSTTKMRAVFNCSLKTKKGPSLNEASYAGVNLMKDMLELTMLFRTNHYVLLGDIRKAFLMIKLKSIKDRNRFCFFMKEGDKLICYRFKTILFGFNASPFILNFIIKHHANRYAKDECTDILLNNFFVDNLVKTHNDPNKLSELYQTAVERMDQGGFDLRSCNSNVEQLKEMMIKDMRYIEHGCEFDKVLGYKYSPSRDVIKLGSSNIDLMAGLITKRTILSQFARVFDPLSLTAPVTIRGKILLSEIWKKKKKSVDHWDEEVDEEDNRAWTSLSKDLSGLSSVEFPRFSLSDDEPTDLFLFCDASKSAYGYVAYAVQKGKSCFVLAKSKVAPIQTKTLPVLELLAVFLAFNGLFSLLNTFSKVKINNIFVGIDAQVVITWLLTDVVKTKNQFARNRIRDVHKMKGDLLATYDIPIHIKYVHTSQNPGDLLTRGLSLQQFKQNLNFWIYGPLWLQSEEIIWPVNDLNCLSEASKSVVLNTQVCVKSPQPLVPFNRYSKLNKLIGVTAKVIEGTGKLNNKFKVSTGNSMQKLWGSSDPHQCAKIYLLRFMQKECFPDELEYLQNPQNKDVPNLVSSLNLFIDKSGVLRSDGRSGKCDAYEYDLVNPILIAKNHDLTKLIIEDCHLKCQHLGIGSTLNKVRMSGFWIPRARQAVKNVLSSCFMCKKFNSLSFKYPKVTNLPKHRVNLVKPFKHVGLDYTGTIMVKDSKGFKKMYLLIFTCLNVRAVHIELVPDMNTYTLVLAIIRFTNIYGVPSHIYSDNAKSFIAGCDIMKEIFLASEFHEHYSKYNIKHIRIPAYSAWVGSTWERMIRVIKSCMYKVIGRATLGYYKLLTILSDVQNAVNSRPLTYRCSDDHGLEGITPNCFIRPYVNDNLLFKSNDESILETGPPTRQRVTESLLSRDKTLEQFRKMWYEEYLISLREQWKDLHEINFSNKLKVDDVVLVKGPPDKKRTCWRLGRVMKLFPGGDGKVRSASIKRADGEIAHHSVNHLYPLELALTHDYVVKSSDQSSDQRITDTSSIAEPSDSLTSSEVVETTGENLVALGNQDIVDSDVEPSFVSDPVFKDDQVLHVTSNEDNSDIVEFDNSNLVDDPEDHFLPRNVLNEQAVGLGNDNLGGVGSLPNGRPKRITVSKGRPLDDQFVYYK